MGDVVKKSWLGFRDFELLPRLQATSGVLQDRGSHIARANSLNMKDLEA